MTYSTDARKFAPATQRNREAILNVLLEVLPPGGTVLEVSSGSGEHAVFFAPQLKPRQWIPSDLDPGARSSILAWQAELPSDNLYPPLALDVCDPVWPVEQDASPEALQTLDLGQNPIVAIVNINMIHISPWEACSGLMTGAGRILPVGGILYLYGPFKQGGQHTAESNQAFDRSLRLQNPNWGVRDLDDVVKVAEQQNLAFIKTISMPANNLSVIFQVGS